MDIFYSLMVARLIFILGIVNLASGLLIFFSCRCLPGAKIAGKLMQYQPYRTFYTYHCHIWKIFWPAVIVHAFLAVAYFGWPA